MTHPERDRLIAHIETTQEILISIKTVFPQATAAWVGAVLRGEVPAEKPDTKQAEPPVARQGAFVLNTDGACRGNPGPSGAGWVLSTRDGQVVRTGQSFLGRATNNEAEYVAVVLGLEDCLATGVTDILLRADSELLIKQLKGQYRVKNARLKPLYEQVKALSQRFERFSCEHVRREYNREADKQANLAIDQH